MLEVSWVGSGSVSIPYKGKEAKSLAIKYRPKTWVSIPYKGKEGTYSATRCKRILVSIPYTGKERKSQKTQ